MATKKKAATRRPSSTRSTKKKAAKRPTKKKATRPTEPEARLESPDQADQVETRGPGRPPGSSTNGPTPVVDTIVSRCRKCGSTNRAPYWGKIERDCRVVRDGVEFTHLVLRSTRCTDCGTIRRDRHFENRPTPVADQVEAKRDQVDAEPIDEKQNRRGRRRQLGQRRGLVG